MEGGREGGCKRGRKTQAFMSKMSCRARKGAEWLGEEEDKEGGRQEGIWNRWRRKRRKEKLRRYREKYMRGEREISRKRPGIEKRQ